MLRSRTGPVSPRDMRSSPQNLTRSMRAAKFGALYLRELDRQPIEHTPRGPRDGMRDVGLNTIVDALRWEVEGESAAGGAAGGDVDRDGRTEYVSSRQGDALYRSGLHS